MYEYNAVVVRVIDADTIDVRVDLGFNVHIDQRVRFFGINAPEKNTPLGIEAAGYVRKTIPLGTKIILQSDKDDNDKYGRYLARIILPETNECLNDILVNKRYAVEYFGKGKKEDFLPPSEAKLLE